MKNPRVLDDSLRASWPVAKDVRKDRIEVL